MRRGQSTLEYILIVGIVAAGLIAMIFYVSRGHQGYLRSQADQLSQGQYAPGRTRINNREHKTLLSSVTSSSTTTTTHPANPVGQRNEALEGPVPDPDSTEPPTQGLLNKIGKAKMNLYFLYYEWETTLITESIGEDSVSGEAGKVRKNTLPWPWNQPPAPLKEKEKLIDDALCGLDYSGTGCPVNPYCEFIPYCKDGDSTSYAYEMRKALGQWKAREKDTSSSSSSTGEEGTIDTTRHTNESLGAL